jgi:hypothetical protein
LTHGSPTKQTQSHTSRSSDNAIEMEDSHPATNPFELQRWLTPFAWWDKHTSNWGPGISASTTQANSISDSNDSYEHSTNKTRPQQGSNPYPFNSSPTSSLQHTPPNTLRTSNKRRQI